MMLRQPAGPVLSPFVETIWWSDVGSGNGRERALPTGSMTLVINLGTEPIRIFRNEQDTVGRRFPHSVVWGPQTRYVVRDASRRGAVLGLQFRPGMAGALLGVAPSELTDNFAGLEDLLGAKAAAVRDRLLGAGSPQAAITAAQQALQAVRRPLLPHPAVAYALRQLIPSPAVSIEEVRSHTGYGPKRFIELFRAATGMTPKRFSRLRRFQRVLAQPSRTGHLPDWAAVAADAGYADQAHLTHEFKAFAGITPGAYRPADPSRPHHVPEEKNLQEISIPEQ